MADMAPQGFTILAVEDSASVRKLVELTLRREGYGLVSAMSGLTALAALAEHRPDMVLLDVMLEALDGFQICRAIRRRPEFDSMPIIVLSGRQADADREAGFQAGVTDYLTKPFQPAELLQVVRRHASPRSTLVRS